MDQAQGPGSAGSVRPVEHEQAGLRVYHVSHGLRLQPCAHKGAFQTPPAPCRGDALWAAASVAPLGGG